MIISSYTHFRQEVKIMIEMLQVFKALSDRTRLRIVRLLLHQDLCVCEIMYVLGLAQSRLSHQLRILRDAGLVEDTRDGQWIIYRVSPGSRATIARLLAVFAKDRAHSPDEEAGDRKKLKECLEKGFRRKKAPAAAIGPEI
jgi:ArsR family transcriptional regulator